MPSILGRTPVPEQVPRHQADSPACQRAVGASRHHGRGVAWPAARGCRRLAGGPADADRGPVRLPGARRPDAAPQSIRFFAIDPNWTAALVDGALSLAAKTAPAAAAVATLRPAALAAASPPVGGYSGFLLRSALVSDWPGLRVTGYADPQATTPLATARLERLAPTVLLAVFAGLMQRVDLAEPPPHLHAGVSPSAAPPSVSLRLIDAGNAGVQPTGSERGGPCAKTRTGRSSTDRHGRGHRLRLSQVYGSRRRSRRWARPE